MVAVAVHRITNGCAGGRVHPNRLLGNPATATAAAAAAAVGYAPRWHSRKVAPDDGGVLRKRFDPRR